MCRLVQYTVNLCDFKPEFTAVHLISSPDGIAAAKEAISE